MKLNTLILAAAALFAAPAFAHDDATLDAMAAPHGGQLRMSGAWHLELVLAKDARGDAPAPVRVYLSDHGGKPMPVAGASGSAVRPSGSARHAGASRREPSSASQNSGRPAARSVSVKATAWKDAFITK